MFIRTFCNRSRQNQLCRTSGLFRYRPEPAPVFFRETSDVVIKRPRPTQKLETWKEKMTQIKSQKMQNQWSTREVRVSPEVQGLSREDPALRVKTHKDGEPYPFEGLYGVSPCMLALTQGRRKFYKLFVKDEDSQRTSVQQVCHEAHQRGVRVQRVTQADLQRMSGGKVHQGVCLKASPLTFLTEDSIKSRGSKKTPLWLILDQVQDPMNLGAILRTAYYLGVDLVGSSIQRSCPLTPAVSKASSGVMEVMGVYGFESLEDLVRGKLAQGWQVVGTVGAEGRTVQTPIVQCLDFKMTRPTLLLFGGEGPGLSQNLLKLCDMLLTIPAGRDLVPGIDSLNVSVAAGVLLHSLLSKRTDDLQ